MKKIIVAIIALCTCLFLTLGLVGCGLEPNELTKEQFEKAMALENLSNVTVSCEYKEYVEAEPEVSKYTAFFDGDKFQIDYEDDSLNAFFEVSNDELYAYYDMRKLYNDSTFLGLYNGWVKVKVNLTEESYTAIQAIKDVISQIKFENCEYEDGYYTCTQNISYEDIERPLNFKIIYEEGVLKSLYCEYEDNGVKCSELYEFSNLGTTTVSLPADYKNLSEITPSPSSNWGKYFEFENVSVELTETITYTAPYEMQVDSNSSILIADGNWFLEEETRWVYFDGDNIWLNGAIDDDENDSLFYAGDQFLGMVEMFSMYESNFTETSTGVFEAEEIIVATSAGSWKDIKIIVEDNKIKQIEFTMHFDYSGTVGDMHYLYMFTDYGETVLPEVSSLTPPVNWVDYFVFDNVTATKTTIQNPGGTPAFTTTETMKKEDDKWSLKRVNAMSQTDVVYWDGTQINTTIQSSLTEDDLKSIGETWFNEFELLSYIESELEETSTGVFELDQIVFTSTYSDIKIVIVDDNIQSIEYVCVSEILEGSITQDVKVVFTNWGTTVVDGLPSA